MSPEAQAGEIESTILATHDLAALTAGNLPGGLKLKGTRRALRFALNEPGLTAGDDEHGTYIELTFAAPSGCYATVVTGEICKPDLSL